MMDCTSSSGSVSSNEPRDNPPAVSAWAGNGWAAVAIRCDACGVMFPVPALGASTRGHIIVCPRCAAAAATGFVNRDPGPLAQR